MVRKDELKNICKYSLIVLNAICLVCGLILIGAGIFLLVYKADLLTYVYSMRLARPAAIIIITIGSIVLITSFLGLTGAVKENGFILAIYSCIMIPVCLLAIVGVILAIVTRFPYNGFDFIRQQMRESLQKVYGVNVNTSSYNAFITDMWDLAQQNWYCCAAEDSSWGIYRQSVWYENQPGEKENDRPMVPPSCCVKDQYGKYINLQKCQTWQSGPPKLASSATVNEALFYSGCYVYGSQLLQRVSGGLIAMGVAIAIIVGLACICSVFLVAFIFGRKHTATPPQQKFSMYSSTTPGVWNAGQTYT